MGRHQRAIHSVQLHRLARQLASGTWTSKLGPDEDISHHTPAALEGALYGTVVVLMKRRRGKGSAENESATPSQN